ncbi:MAG: hypothetical protein D8M57_19695 [Candidatus Scalindua sp. AMX11]|nr:hypothetical protein [Planctomycetota bacterium]RZV61140.1 MAG: hypothetical protein EX341_19000 [Candidatus Scalindua sp. SCAELEC01]TDE63173.1 MAG: hypothetical protein D8M57_19695 [Candidatus Scalindua sp. AMX11]GJQ57409.1 MAG: hypothetical protein SCALA701_02100 [Candidatus Scalindua sp.]
MIKGKNIGSTLFITFWNICLDNLPQGQFSHRTITTDEARRMIREAEDRVVCVSNDDLCAPYKTKEAGRYSELCKLLTNTYDILISFNDFIHGDTILPLQCVEIKDGNRLMVINCHYSMPEIRDRDLISHIVADSVTFHIIETVDGAVTEEFKKDIANSIKRYDSTLEKLAR